MSACYVLGCHFLSEALVDSIHARITALGYEEADMISVDAVEGVAMAKELTDKGAPIFIACPCFYC